MDINIEYLQLPREPSMASKYLVDMLCSKIYPLVLRIRNNLQVHTEQEECFSNIQNVFILCCSQIKKCLLNMFDILKLEQEQGIFLQESRQCTLERLSWCVNRLTLIEEKLDSISQKFSKECFEEDSLFSTPLYFVNWMDNTFEILSKLAEIVYRTDYKENDQLYYEWKLELLECVRVLHTSLDELLLSAMTLCKYCLPSDQIIVKTRCQVVLRESKVLLSEIIADDVDGKFTATINSLKLPIMATNINVNIDVLKDVLYVLETNTNTALLALVVHCFSSTMSPVDVLKEHFCKTDGCPYHDNSENNVVEDCDYVKEFDLYSERLLQIGSFAVSCSSDQERIVSLRSGLASLEALDPHLVPALMLSPASWHATLLTDTWRKEVQDIRDSVFLIVDPVAFAEKSKQLMHHDLKELLKRNKYDNAGVRSVIDIGCVVQEFFSVYRHHEPNALMCRELLLPLLDNLDKAVSECKVVSNLLCSKDEFAYDVKKPTHNKEVSLEQLMKRLKLLYTLVNRIHSLLHPEEDNEFFKSVVEEEPVISNATFVKHQINDNTYVGSPKKPPNNVTRSNFATRTNIRTPAKRYPLKKLFNQIKAQKCSNLNFSVQLDELFNLSEFEKPNKSAKTGLVPVNKNSILYNFSPRKNRSSLRKMVLNKRYNLTSAKPLEEKDLKTEKLVKESLMDDTTSLQISEILDQMHDMSKLLSTTKNLDGNSSKLFAKSDLTRSSRNDATILKHVRNITADASALETETEAANATDATVPSDVSTLERLRDLNHIQSKLNNLKLLQKETRL